MRHEKRAVHAADEYARAEGKVGVALVALDPGATNAVAAIATAYMDSIDGRCRVGGRWRPPESLTHAAGVAAKYAKLV